FNIFKCIFNALLSIYILLPTPITATINKKPIMTNINIFFMSHILSVFIGYFCLAFYFPTLLLLNYLYSYYTYIEKNGVTNSILFFKIYDILYLIIFDYSFIYVF